MRWHCQDETKQQPRTFFVDVEFTRNLLLSREDTDNNMQITIDDNGPKVCCEDGRVNELEVNLHTGTCFTNGRLQRIK